MNRITELFQRKDRNLLSVYFTAGYPVLEDTVEIIQMLENRGVDLVEIGIPFSDPMADGVVYDVKGILDREIIDGRL